MIYESQLRQLIANQAKTDRTTTDDMIYCPRHQQLARMVFRGHAWICLKDGCGFTILEKDLPGPEEIRKLIKEVDYENKTGEVKDVIKEVIGAGKER